MTRRVTVRLGASYPHTRFPADTVALTDARTVTTGGSVLTHDPITGNWPTAAGQVGVKESEKNLLPVYAGPAIITTPGTVIDGFRVNYDLNIRAANVTIRNCYFTNCGATQDSGTGDDASASWPWTLSWCTFDVRGGMIDAVGNGYFTADHLYIIGGRRSMYANHSTVEWCLMDGQNTSVDGFEHQSGFRSGQYTTLRHSSIRCNAPDVPPDGGCSASLTGYPEWYPMHHNTYEYNLIRATTGGYAAYFGDTAKQYQSDPANCTYYTVTNNVFERGAVNGQWGYPMGGYYGPITDWKDHATSVWSGNTWDTPVGQTITANTSTWAPQ